MSEVMQLALTFDQGELASFEAFAQRYQLLEELNATEILGQTIAVEWAFVKGPRKTRKRRD